MSMYHEITTEEALHGHEIGCQLIVQLILSLWKWGTIYTTVIHKQFFLGKTHWMKAESLLFVRK